MQASCSVRPAAAGPRPARPLGSCRPLPGRLQPWRGAGQRSQLWAAAQRAPSPTTAGSEVGVNGGDRALDIGSGDWSAGEADTRGGSPHIVPFPGRGSGGGGGGGGSGGGGGEAEAEAARKAAGGSARSAPSWPSDAARRCLYSDVPVERVDSLHCRVRGKLPAWLRGSFYRNGPGKFGGALSAIDGCAMIVRFRLDGPGGEAVLSHRFLDTVYHRAAQAEGSIRWRMAHLPCGGGASGALQGLAYAGGMALGALQYGAMADNAVVAIVPHGNELIAHTETLQGTYRVHPETLETLGRVRYRDDLHGMVKTAHLSTLPNGDLVGLAADFAPPTLDRETGLLRMPELTVFRQSPWQADRRVKVAAVPYRRPTAPTWVHEVPVSERHAVVVQSPVHYSIRSMLLGRAGEYLAFDWRPEEGSVLHVVPLLGGEVRSYRAPAFLAGHFVNAFESPDGRLLHLDACVADSPAIMAHWRLDTVRAGPGGPQMTASHLRRLTIDLTQADASVLPEPVLQPLAPDAATGDAFEMPAIHPAYRCRPYRWAYGTCCVRPTNCWNALCKVDTQTGDVKVWHEAGGATWEPVFVPRPGGRAEDDGVVLSSIMQADGCSALLVLDARTWREVARCVVPYGLPQGFHAAWVPS